jgi:protein phosphatase
MSPVADSSDTAADIGYHTAVGRVRDHNEDSLKVVRERSLFAVADGMGGHLAGERASALAVEVLQEQCLAEVDKIDGEILRAALTAANAAIFQESVDKPERRGMGTTLTALHLTGDSYWIGHIGDSRAWLVRDNVGVQITEDHSVVWEQMRAGLITSEQAERHPMRNVLTRSVGNLPEVEVDVLTGETRRDDVWVLGTDGMTQAFDQNRVAEIVAESSSAQMAAERMVEIAVEEDGSDNVSVVVVRCA